MILFFFLLLSIGISYAYAKSSLSIVSVHGDSNKTQYSKVKSIILRAQHEALRGGMSGAVAGIIQVVTMMWLRTTTNYQYRHGVSMTTAMIQVCVKITQ